MSNAISDTFNSALDWSSGLASSIVGGLFGNYLNQGSAEDQYYYNSLLMKQQYGYNSALQQAANKFTADQYATRYQTAVKDMQAAGLNPLLLAGATPSSPSSASASVSGGSAGLQTANISGNGKSTNLLQSALMRAQTNSAEASARQSDAMAQASKVQAAAAMETASANAHLSRARAARELSDLEAAEPSNKQKRIITELQNRVLAPDISIGSDGSASFNTNGARARQIIEDAFMRNLERDYYMSSQERQMILDAVHSGKDAMSIIRSLRKKH